MFLGNQQTELYFCTKFTSIIALFTNMATKIQQILEANPNSKIFFSEWLTSQGLDAKEQHAYMKRRWLTHLSKGVYALQGTNPILLHAVSAYNKQLSKNQTIVDKIIFLFVTKQHLYNETSITFKYFEYLCRLMKS